MCRHLAWVGDPVAPAALVLAPPHSLEHQSYAARELLRGVVCADGFGIGWYADGDHPRQQRFWSGTAWGDRRTRVPRLLVVGLIAFAFGERVAKIVVGASLLLALAFVVYVVIFIA